jgi:SHS2 domain-containing protein
MIRIQVIQSMPYQYLDNIATADVAFKAHGSTMEETFIAAARATLNVMVADIDAVAPRLQRQFTIEAESAEMLLFDFLQELLFLKDAGQLLLCVHSADIQQAGDCWTIGVQAAGERIDESRHEMLVDVKAVTLHRFDLRKTADGWMTTVVLDI